MLAGLISDEDRSSASRIPGLGDIPLLGRLFSNHRDERNKTEIVLLITPRILRSDATRQPAITEFRGGTENSIGGGLGGSSYQAPLSPEIPQPEMVQPQQADPSEEAPQPTPALPAMPPMPVPNIPGLAPIN